MSPELCEHCSRFGLKHCLLSEMLLTEDEAEVLRFLIKEFERTGIDPSLHVNEAGVKITLTMIMNDCPEKSLII